MSGTKKLPAVSGDISPTHPNAAAIDIGATMHVAAVGPDKASEPVRSFGTFTGDLRYRLADLVRAVRRPFGRDGVHGVYWIPGVRNTRPAWLRSHIGQRPRCQTRAGPQDRYPATPNGCSGCTNMKVAQGQLPAEG